MEMERVNAAVRGALVSRGPSKGMLKSSPPRHGTDAYAAWQALVLCANPYKVSIGGLMMMGNDQREVYEVVLAWAESRDVRGLDRDRVALEQMGAW
jgi:hypothetical protein